MIPKKIWLSLFAMMLFSCSLLQVIPLPAPPGSTGTPGLPIETVEATSTVTLPPADTPTPTYTALPSATATLIPTPTAAPSATPTAFAPQYHLQEGSPAYLSNFAHPNQGCGWMGVAGQVFGVDEKPVANLVVIVEGVLAGETLDLLGVAGANTDYGPGGYEIILAKEALASSRALSVRLHALDGSPLSEAVLIDTFADCARNLVVINWIAAP